MNIKTALILCAGFGKRLKPLTLKNPKPLLKLYDKTLLEHSLNLIKKLHIKKIKLNTFYLRENIEKFIENINLDLEIELINDGDQILDTGGGIYNMIKHSNEENFLVLNPDTYWSEQYINTINEMERYYYHNNIKNILLVVKKNLSVDKNISGDFNFKNNFLTRDNSKDFIYTGCQILNKHIFKNLDSRKFSMNQIWDDLIKNKSLIGFKSNNKFIHVSDINIYKKLLENN